MLAALVVGGNNGTTSNQLRRPAELLHPGAANWIAVPPMNEPRFDHTATLLPSGKVLVIGGARGAAAEVFDHGLRMRANRDRYKRFIEEAGGTRRLLYFGADRTFLLARLAERNRRADANALNVTPEALEDFCCRFEKPSDEGEEVIDGH